MGKISKNPTVGNNGFFVEPGDNSEITLKMLELYNMPSINLDSDEAVKNRIQEYFKYCVDNDVKPGVEGMAMAIGVNRRTLWDWENGISRNQTSTRAEIIKRAKQFLALYLEHLAMNGKVNPVTWIFMMKNHFNYTDKQEFEIIPRNPLGDTLSPEEIAKRAGLPGPNETLEVEYEEQ